MSRTYTESEYKAHAERVQKESGFTPIWADLEGRERSRKGIDVPKVWVGELYRTLKYIPFELPTKETISSTFILGAENLAGKKIDPRFPFAQFSITRIPNGDQTDQIVVTFQIFVAEEAKLAQIHEAFMDEFSSLKDIGSERQAQLYSRFDEGQGQTLELKEERELPNELTRLVEPKNPPLYHSLQLTRVFNLGDRTSAHENQLASDSIFVVDPVQAV